MDYCGKSSPNSSHRKLLGSLEKQMINLLGEVTTLQRHSNFLKNKTNKQKKNKIKCDLNGDIY